jgi:hypothetical protein
MIDSRHPGLMQNVLWALNLDRKAIQGHPNPQQLIDELEQAFQDFDLLVAEKIAQVEDCLQEDARDRD